MIGVWDGEKVEFKDVGKGPSKIFEGMRQVLSGGLVEVLPNSLAVTNRLTSELRRSGILCVFDEEGLLKRLPVTLRLETIELVGKIIFCGWKSSNFRPLTTEQQALIKESLARFKGGS